MKKLKLLKPLMVVPVAATPLCVLASCGGADYIEFATELKDQTLTIFENEICPSHRSTWDCGEAADRIRKYMKKLDPVVYAEPTGWDEWSKIKDVIKIGDDELTQIYPKSWKGPKFSAPYPDYGNMWYDLPATKGHETDPKITLQSHYDMPIEFNDESWASWSETEWLSGGVKWTLDQENEILKSRDDSTCLGADNGLGIALMLAIAANRNNFEHGPIRLLFNVDESASVEDTYVFPDGTPRNEDIVAGADLLRYDQIYNQYPSPAAAEKGEGVESYSHAGTIDGDPFPFGEDYSWSNILSLDGIVKGRIYQSSAGIHDCSMSAKLEPIDGDIENLTEIGDSDALPYYDADNPVFKVEVSGLHGGYSSEDINMGYANALQILMRLIGDDSIDQKSGDDITKYGFHILYLNVPTRSSNIPAKATAFITSSALSKDYPDIKTTEEFLKKKAEIFKNATLHSYPNEKGIEINVTKGDDTDIDHRFTGKDLEIVSNVVDEQKYMLNSERSLELCEFFSSLLYGPMTYFDDSFKEVKTSQSFGPLDILMEKNEDGDPACSVSFRIIIRSADPDERWLFSEFAHLLALRTISWIGDIDSDIEDAILPIWEYNKNDKLVDLAREGYTNLGYKPEVTHLHGWAEIASYPRIWELGGEGEEHKPFITCIGPTITEIHKQNEAVWTDTMVSWIRNVLYICDHAIKLRRT